MSKCPFCGTHQVSKTFNFNEYTCNLCECDYKHVSDGIKIFQEGSWAKFCNSITESVSAKSGATVVDLVSKVMRGYSKRGPDEIDLVIESLTSIASTLNSEMKVGLRGKQDFLTIVEQINTAVTAAHALHRRQEDLGIKIRMNEGILDWFKGEDDVVEEPESTLGGPSGPYEDNEEKMRANINAAKSNQVDSIEEGSMSDLDIIAQEAVDSLGDSAGDDGEVISYIQNNHPDEVEHINLILQSVHEKVGNVSDGAQLENEQNHDENGERVLDELVPVYRLDPESSDTHPDLEIEPSDEETEDHIEVGIEEDEDPFAVEGDSDGNTDGNTDGGVEDDGVNGEVDDTDNMDVSMDDTGDQTDDSMDINNDDVIADVQDAAETVQDKFSRLETKIDDLLTAVNTLTGEDSGEDVSSEMDSGEMDINPEETDVDVNAEETENVEDSGEETPGDNSTDENPFAESTLGESKNRKIGVNTSRGKGSVSSYQRKQSAANAVAKTEKDGEDRTDMNAEVEEEEIPFTEQPKGQMKKDTDSDAPGATKKPTGKVSYREGFNGFRIGDEILIEGSTDTWNIIGIENNVFTLSRGKTTTTVDIFKESVRHVDSRLEWQTTEELMRESKKRWASVSSNYVTDSEKKITGVIGLGGGNRIGGNKFGSSELSEVTKIPVVESNGSDRKDIYKYIKDNALHRCDRQVAVQRACERFTNPVEEINNIVDDAVLSEDASQVESIDSQYGYTSAPIGEHALRQAFQRGWKSVNESESKQQKTAPKKVVTESRGVGYYRTAEDKLIDGIGRTAADRLMGK
jgi:hypothetical protein